MTDLWTRWQPFKSDRERSEEADLIASYRNEERYAETPVPFCCSKIAGFRIAVPGIPNSWSSFFHHRERQQWTDVTHCPFCGTKLPGFKLKASPPPHRLHEDDEDMCSHCDGRWGECMCSFPESAWEVDNAPEVTAVAAVFQRESGYKTKYLSVSRKNNHADKGFPGGRIEPGETPEQALVREVLEETGLVVKAFHLVFDVRDSSGHRCQFFRVTEFEGKPSSAETGLIEWLEPRTLVEQSSFGETNSALFQVLNQRQP